MKYLFIIIALFFVACKGSKNIATESVGQIVELSDSIIETRRADTISFGRLRKGESATREFTIKNTDTKALVITQLDLSCGCVSADYPRQPLMPGSEAPMSLTLDTRDLNGWVFKTVGVRTSLEKGSYTLCVTAEIIAE